MNPLINIYHGKSVWQEIRRYRTRGMLIVSPVFHIDCGDIGHCIFFCLFLEHLLLRVTNYLIICLRNLSPAKVFLKDRIGLSPCFTFLGCFWGRAWLAVQVGLELMLLHGFSRARVMGIDHCAPRSRALWNRKRTEERLDESSSWDLFFITALPQHIWLLLAHSSWFELVCQYLSFFFISTILSTDPTSSQPGFHFWRVICTEQSCMKDWTHPLPP